MKSFVKAYDEWIMNDISDGAFRLLCLIGKFARGKGTCRLGTDDLARNLRVSDREIRFRLGELETAGFIRREYLGSSRRHLAGIVPTVPDRKARPESAPQTEQGCRLDGTGIPSLDGTAVPSRRNEQTGLSVPSGVGIPVPSLDGIPVPSGDGIPVPSLDGTQVPSPDGTQVPSPLNSSEDHFPEDHSSEDHTQSACACEGPDPDVPARDRNGEPIGLDCGERPDPEALRKLARYADELFPMMAFSTQVHAFGATYPLDWIRQALDEARTWRTPPRSFKPIWNCLQAWARQGGPPSLGLIPFAQAAAVAPAKVDRAQAKVDEFRRYMAAKAAKAAAEAKEMTS